jgi:hypothetical protein
MFERGIAIVHIILRAVSCETDVLITAQLDEDQIVRS